MAAAASATPWAQACVGLVTDVLRAQADPVRAAPMRRYMRDQFDFLGLTSPQRRVAVRSVLRSLEAPSARDLLACADGLWELPEREFVYAACDVLARFVPVLPPEALGGPLRRLVTTRPWWDSVDSLAGGTIRPMLVRHPGLTEVLCDWSGSGDRWLVRVAVTAQLGRGAGTDADRLFGVCARHGTDPEFFVAKAVGWALRDYARTDPAAVAGFVAAHPDLAPVARREALKHLT